MNKEELNEALKIINEPITVNSVEYKYFDIDNYNKLVNVIDYCHYLNDKVKPYVEAQDKEIDRLNNIINELEKWLEDYIKLFDDPDMLEEQTCEDLKEVLNKLQELKGE